MSYWKPHLTRQLPLEIGPQTVAESLSVTPATGASFPFALSNDTGYGAVGANTLRTAAQIGNATGAADFGFGAAGAQTLRVAALLGNAAGLIDFNAGVPSAQTVRTAQAMSVASFQSAGEILGTALTGTYATVLTLTADAVCLVILNTTNNTIFVSLDGGTSDTLKLESGESTTLDFGTNSRRIASGTAIQAKHAGAAPTQGTIRVSRVG